MANDVKTNLEYAMEAGDLRDALEVTDTRTNIWTKRAVIERLANDLAWDYDSEQHLNAVVRSLLGHFFDPPGVDLNNAAARAIWIEAHFKVWCERLGGKSPTQEQLVQMYGEMIRALGDDPTYGLPKRRRRTKSTKQDATIIALVPPQKHDTPCEDNADQDKC